MGRKYRCISYKWHANVCFMQTGKQTGDNLKWGMVNGCGVDKGCLQQDNYVLMGKDSQLAR